MALYKSFTYLLTKYQEAMASASVKFLMFNKILFVV